MSSSAPVDPGPDAPLTRRERIANLGDTLARRRDEARRKLPPVDIALSTFERDNRIGGFLAAGAIAFRLFVYLLPLYLLGLVIAGATFSADPSSPERLAESSGMSHYLAGSIGEASETSNKSLWILVPVTR